MLGEDLEKSTTADTLGAESLKTRDKVEDAEAKEAKRATTEAEHTNGPSSESSKQGPAEKTPSATPLQETTRNSHANEAKDTNETLHAS